MAGEIFHEWQGTTLVITSDSGTSGCNLVGPQGEIGVRGPQGAPGNTGEVDYSVLEPYATEEYVKGKIAEAQIPEGSDIDLSSYPMRQEMNEAIAEATEDVVKHTDFTLDDAYTLPLIGVTDESGEPKPKLISSGIGVENLAYKSEIENVAKLAPENPNGIPAMHIPVGYGSGDGSLMDSTFTPFDFVAHNETMKFITSYTLSEPAQVVSLDVSSYPIYKEFLIRLDVPAASGGSNTPVTIHANTTPTSGTYCGYIRMGIAGSRSVSWYRGYWRGSGWEGYCCQAQGAASVGTLYSMPKYPANGTAPIETLHLRANSDEEINWLRAGTNINVYGW